MDRRKFLKVAFCGLLAVGVSHIACSSEEGLAREGIPPLSLEEIPRPRERPPLPKDAPNVLFLSIDDLNDWIGCLGGHPDARTPNIDRLAQRGVIFTNAHSPAAACNPSRSSILTGIWPSTSGIYSNLQYTSRQALPRAVTIPQHFTAHGYRVVGGGKIFHQGDPESWQEHFPSKTKTKPDSPRPTGRPLNGFRLNPNYADFDWGPIDVADNDMADGKVAAWAVEELSKNHTRPFFLGVGISRPHLPWYVPKKYFEFYPSDQVTLPKTLEDDLDDVPPIARGFALVHDHQAIIKYNLWGRAVSAYLACVSFADAMVGKILDALDASPYVENTVIVLWSDHGYHLGEKSSWHKFTLWEESTRSPLIFAAPGITTPGGRCSRPVSLSSIYPTLIDLCGLTPREELESKSILPLLKDPGTAWDQPALTTHLRNNHSLRSERWRYTRYRDGTEELYDHQNDELEWRNLADKKEFSGVKEELSQWFPWLNAPGAPRRPGDKNE